MNKLTKILIATLGGIETVFYILTPILIGLIWVNTFDMDNSYIIYSISLISTVFRAIKKGWLEK
jgi:hypothetical protein